MESVLPFEAYYENSFGEKLWLDRAPYVINDGTLFNHEWKFTTSSRPLNEGTKLLSAKRPNTEKTVELDVYADSAKELADALEDLEKHFGKDISALSAGKLWIGNRFMRCWCRTGKKELSRDFVSMAKVTLSVMPEIPVWCRETVYAHLPGVSEDVQGHKYSYRYPYRYGTGMSGINIYNMSYLPSPMRIIFYGPAVNPRIVMDGKVIGVNTTLLAGEYAVIDQLMRQIYKISKDGVRTNIFDSRVKNGLVFDFALPGTSFVNISSDAGVDITVIEQRSEPRWSLR